MYRARDHPPNALPPRLANRRAPAGRAETPGRRPAQTTVRGGPFARVEHHGVPVPTSRPRSREVSTRSWHKRVHGVSAVPVLHWFWREHEHLGTTGARGRDSDLLGEGFARCQTRGGVGLDESCILVGQPPDAARAAVEADRLTAANQGSKS